MADIIKILCSLIFYSGRGRQRQRQMAREGEKRVKREMETTRDSETTR